MIELLATGFTNLKHPSERLFQHRIIEIEISFFYDWSKKMGFGVPNLWTHAAHIMNSLNAIITQAAAIILAL